MKTFKTLIVILILLAMFAVPASAISYYCVYARYNPAFAVLCFWALMWEYSDPFDWGDSDADDYANG